MPVRMKSSDVSYALVTRKAVLPQGQALSGQLDEMRLVETHGGLGRLSALVFYWRDFVAIALQEVDPAAHSCLGSLKRD